MPHFGIFSSTKFSCTPKLQSEANCISMLPFVTTGVYIMSGCWFVLIGTHTCLSVIAYCLKAITAESLRFFQQCECQMLQGTVCDIHTEWWSICIRNKTTAVCETCHSYIHIYLDYYFSTLWPIYIMQGNSANTLYFKPLCSQSDHWQLTFVPV